MKSLPGLSADMESLGDVSSVLFNAAIHGVALTDLPLKFPGNYILANSTLHLCILALCGLWDFVAAPSKPLVPCHRFMVAYGRGVHYVCLVAILAGLLYSTSHHGSFGRQLP